MSDITYKDFIQNNKGTKLSEETRSKISENHADVSGKNNPKAKKIIRLLDDKIYDCIIDAAKDNNMARYTITQRCKLHKEFMYYDEWLTKQNDTEGLINE